MNAEAEPQSAEIRPAINSFSSIRWSSKKLLIFILFAFAIHLAFVFVLGTKRPIQPRPATDAPHFQFTETADELIALEDPTLFAQPHLVDYVPAVWRKTPDLPQLPTRWTEPPPFLAPAVETWGATFRVFMASNELGQMPLNFKPSPAFSVPKIDFSTALPQASLLQITGDVSRRTLKESILVPTLKWNDVIAPSRVQVLVNPQGNVVSYVLLQSSEYDKADQAALELARQAKFEPGPSLDLGEMIFHWHTVPTNAP
jgi:TonB family protein